MIKAQRRFDFYLQDMQEALERIHDYTANITFEEFISNTMLRDAVIRNFEVLGESVKHIPFKFQKKHKSLPWRHMFALRNFIVHEYFDIDDDILWHIIKFDLEENLTAIKRIIQQQ
jgi:uncharacterized protein with HEPN domain